MERIRIGNDISVSWALFELSGQPYDFDGKELSLYMVNGGHIIPVASFTIDGNIISWSFLGSEQTATGFYSIIAKVENLDVPGSLYSFDYKNAFALVASSSYNEQSDEQLVTISLRSLLVFNDSEFDFGTRIDSIEQIVESHDNGGTNVVRVNLEDGTHADFNVRNGYSGADEEDITDSDGHGALKFKDRSYNSENPNGMGYVILRKNKTFAEQVTMANTIFEIRYDFDLEGESITIPNNCILKFEGGSLSNGTLIGNNTSIKAGLIKIFNIDITIAGSWNVSEAYPEWFGAKGDGVNDDRLSIQKTIDTFNYICFQSKTYKIGSYSTIDNNKYGLAISRDNVCIEGKALGDWNFKATKITVDSSLELYAVIGILHRSISIKGIAIVGTRDNYISSQYGIACPSLKADLTFEKVFVRFITGTSFFLNAFKVSLVGCTSSDAYNGFNLFSTNGRNTSAVLYKCVSDSCAGNAFALRSMSYSMLINCTADSVGFTPGNLTNDAIYPVFYIENCHCIQILNCASEGSYKVLKAYSTNKEILINNCIFYTNPLVPNDFDYTDIYNITGDVKIENTVLCNTKAIREVFKVRNIFPLGNLIVRDAMYVYSTVRTAEGGGEEVASSVYYRYNVRSDNNRVVIENTISDGELTIDDAYINNVANLTNARVSNASITIPRDIRFDHDFLMKNFKGSCNAYGDDTHNIYINGDSVFTDVDALQIISQHQPVVFSGTWGKDCFTLNNSKITFIGVSFGNIPTGVHSLFTLTNNSTLVLKDCILSFASGDSRSLADVIKCSGNSKVEIYYSDKLIIIDDNGAKQIALSPLS